MIDEYSRDGLGWARFSDDRRMRYRWGRLLHESTLACGWKSLPATIERVVFLLLNPSVADAFRPDPTAKKCCTFAYDWGGKVCEVVNLFAMISPYPDDLRRAHADMRGDDRVNDEQIIDACSNAWLVVAAWGTDGNLFGRADDVCDKLARRGIKIHRIEGALTDNMQPKHPLARGKHHVPITSKAVPWEGPLR